MNRWRRPALWAAALWFFGCLLYAAPAQLFAALAQRGGLQLDNVGGSFWNGRATDAFIALADGRRFALGSLEWRLRPLSLLLLHPDAHVSTRYGDQFADADVRVGPTGTVRLRNVRAGAPLSIFGGWLPLPLPAQGTLALDLAELELSRAGLLGMQGQLSWRGASWQWNTRWLPLGDYRCELRMPGPAQLRGALLGEGALGITGELLIDLKDRNYSLHGQVRAADSLPREFRDALALILGTVRDAQGALALQRDGRW